MQSTMQDRPLTINAIFEHGRRVHADSEIVTFMGDGSRRATYERVAERAEKAAVVLTTNLPFSEWTQVIPNARLCKALLDRITDRAHILETGTESYRFRRTAEKQKKGARSS